MLRNTDVLVCPDGDSFCVVTADRKRQTVPLAGLVDHATIRRAGDEGGIIRVPGYLAASGAICRLWEMYGRSVCVGRPGGHNAWYGDWFAASDGSVLPFRLASLLAEGRTREAGELAATHPLSSPLCYLVGGLDPVRFAAYLVEIRDPRWFAKPDKLDDSAKLAAWFGVYMHNVTAVLGYGEPGFNFHRFRRLVRLDGPAYAGDDLRSTASECEPAMRTAIAREVLRLARRTIRLTHLVWMGDLAGHPEMAFDPARFFDAEEVADYAESPCCKAVK